MPRQGQGHAMNTFWTVASIAAVVAIVATVLWALIVAPFTVPSHSAKP
jgi:signal peptidase I